MSPQTSSTETSAVNHTTHMMGRRHTPETVSSTLLAYPFAEPVRHRRQPRRKSFNNASESDSQAENLGSDAISSLKGRTTSASRVVAAERRTKKILFYRNGDRFFKGKKVQITPQRFLNFTELLNNLAQSVSLPYGVRRIYTLEGKLIGNIEDLKDGKAYVCASFERFKQLNYGTTPLPDWASNIKKSHAPDTIGQLSYGYSYPSTGKYASVYAKATDRMGRRVQDSLFYCRQQNKRVEVTAKTFSGPSDANRLKPRLVKFVRYESSPRKTISILLNRRTVFSFEHLLNEINDAFDLHTHKNQKVCKLYTTKGKELKGVSAFFRETDSMFIAATSRQTLVKVEIEDILEEIFPSKPPSSLPPEPVKLKKKIRDKDSKSDSGVEIDAAGDLRTLSASAELPLVKPTNHMRKKSVPISNQSSNAEFTVRAKSCATPNEREADEKAFAEDKWMIEVSTLPKEELQERKEEELGDQKDEERNTKAGHTKEEDLKKKIKEKKKQMEEKQAELSRKEAEFEEKKEEFRRQEDRKEEEKNKKQEEKCKQKEKERKKEAKRNLHKEKKIEEDKKKEDDKKRKEDEKLKELNEKQEKETIKEQEEKEENERKKREEEKSVAKEEITLYDSNDRPDKESDNQFDIPMKDSMTIFATVVDQNVDVGNSKLLTNTDDTKTVSPAQNTAENRFVPASREIVHRNVILEKYDVENKIGDGNFAEVHKSIRKSCGKMFAMKIVYKSKLLGKEHMIANEIGIMHNIRHQNIVRLYEEYETINHIYLLMEYVSGGDLFDAITESIKFTEADGAQIVGDMARALRYLHDLNIVHRDLKPENLLVSKSPSGDIMVKLADFGLAMVVTEPIFTVCGTPTYVAPEILSESGYGLEVDMWATGVITYILLCGFPPFRSADRDQEELFELIQAGEFEYISPYWENISSDAKDLINHLLVVNQSGRFKADQVLSHPWIVNHNKSDDLPNLQREVSMNLEMNFDGRRSAKSRMAEAEY